MRRALAILVIIWMLGAGCGGDQAATTTAPPVITTAAPTTTTTTTSPTTTSSTTLAPPTTLSQEEQDAPLVMTVWEGYTEAWTQGPEAAARYIVAHTYPGMPAVYEGCLDPDKPRYHRAATPDADTIAPDPGWEPSDLGLEVEGRTYTVDVLFRDGLGADTETEISTVHVTIRDGEPYFFMSCAPPPPPPPTTTTIPAGALAYRLETGAEYGHRVTFRSDITEDQSGAGGTTRTGRETWTHEVEFEVTGTNDEGNPRMAMTFARVTWEMFSGGVHRNAFDSAAGGDPEDWYGIQGDLAGDTSTLTVAPQGPRITSNSSQSFLTLPAAPVTAGDTWQGEWALGDPRLSGTMTITAIEVGDDRVRVSFAGTGSGTRVVEDMFLLDIEYTTEAEISGTALIDAGTGWLRSMTMDIRAEGTIEVTSGGLWMGIRPLAGSRELQAGVPMPVTYAIHIETTTTTG